jgi:hypothetical protein
MLDIVILYFLTREIGKLAERKGLKAFTWKVYTVVAWILSEILGIIAALMFFTTDNIISIALIGFAFAITSYFFIKAQLNKLPDQGGLDDDIDNIGHKY